MTYTTHYLKNLNQFIFVNIKICYSNFTGDTILKNRKKFLKLTHLQIMFILTILLIIYGKISRSLSIPFFWESKHIGFIFIFISIFILVSKKLMKYKKGFFINLLRLVCVLPIFIVSLVNITTYKSNLYNEITTYLKLNTDIVSDIGEVKSFGYLLSGNTIYGDDVDTSNVVIIVKGRYRISEYLVTSNRKKDGIWKVIGIEKIH